MKRTGRLEQVASADLNRLGRKFMASEERKFKYQRFNDIFMELRRRKWPMDPTLLTMAIRSLAVMGSLDLVPDLMEELKQLDQRHYRRALPLLLRAYASISVNRIDAYRLLKENPGLLTEPVLLNDGLDAEILQTIDFEIFWLVLSTTLVRQFLTDPQELVSFTRTMASRDFSTAKALTGYVCGLVFDSPSLSNKLSSLCKENQWDKEQLFETYRLAGIIRAGNRAKVEQVLASFKEEIKRLSGVSEDLLSDALEFMTFNLFEMAQHTQALELLQYYKRMNLPWRRRLLAAYLNTSRYYDTGIRQQEKIWGQFGGSGIEAPRQAYLQMMKTGFKHKQEKKALSYLKDYESLGYTPDYDFLTALMKGFSASGNVRDAIGIVQNDFVALGIKPQTANYAMLIEAYANSLHHEMAIGWYERMVLDGVKPNEMVLNIILKCLFRCFDNEEEVWIRMGFLEDLTVSKFGEEYRFPQELLGEIKDRYESGFTQRDTANQRLRLVPHLACTVFSHLLRRGEIDVALKMLKRLDSDSQSYHVLHCNLISHYLKTGDMPSAFASFEDMKRKRIFFDNHAVSRLIVAYSKVNDVTGAFSAFEHLIRSQCTPSSRVYWLLLRCLRNVAKSENRKRMEDDLERIHRERQLAMGEITEEDKERDAIEVDRMYSFLLCHMVENDHLEGAVAAVKDIIYHKCHLPIEPVMQLFRKLNDWDSEHADFIGRVLIEQETASSSLCNKENDFSQRLVRMMQSRRNPRAFLSILEHLVKTGHCKDLSLYEESFLNNHFAAASVAGPLDQRAVKGENRRSWLALSITPDLLEHEIEYQEQHPIDAIFASWMMIVNSPVLKPLLTTQMTLRIVQTIGTFSFELVNLMWVKYEKEYSLNNQNIHEFSLDLFKVFIEAVLKHREFWRLHVLARQMIGLLVQKNRNSENADEFRKYLIQELDRRDLHELIDHMVSKRVLQPQD